jgi:hypothetical protein
MLPGDLLQDASSFRMKLLLCEIDWSELRLLAVGWAAEQPRAAALFALIDES